MRNEQRTPRSDPSGAAVGGGPAQPAQESGDTASEGRNFSEKAGLAVIGGASSGAFRVVEASSRVALFGDSGTD